MMELSKSQAEIDTGADQVAQMRTGGPSAEMRAAWAREKSLPPTIPLEYGEDPEVQIYDGDEVDEFEESNMEEMEEGEEGFEEPDLRSYFANWQLSAGDQIALCRTYANHLSAALRPKTRGQYKKRPRVPSAEEDVPSAPVAPSKTGGRGWKNLNKPYRAPRRF